MKILIILILLILVVGYLVLLYSPFLFAWYIIVASKDELKPFINIRHRTITRELKSNWTTIRDEMEEALPYFTTIRGDRFFEDTIIKDNKWKKIYLKWYSESPSYAYKLFPKTMKLIDRNSNIHLAMFSLLEPGAKILPHRGPFRGCIRVHLCLSGGSRECYISVNGEKYYWKEGEVVAFDDTYEHYVVNNSKVSRIVLFLDLERQVALPLINRWVINNIAPSTTRQNDEIEKRMTNRTTDES